MWTRIDWSVSSFRGTTLKCDYDITKWKEDNFYDLRQLSNFLSQCHDTWGKFNQSLTYFNSSEN